MTTLNNINNSLKTKRKLLLVILNITLVIFIILEIMVFRERSSIMSEEEFRQHRLQLCNDGHLRARQSARVIQ